MAENPVSKTHLVAVFVDKNIYKDLESDIKWYASQYIQSRISDSKALVLPIDVNNFAAKDIVAMLENMYFDGVKGASSDLLGAVFLGNIPLPVVQQNGFIYPSIYPYVDFEDQQFIYNANQDYFVYNDNPNGQAEIWHGLIDFDTDIDKYSSFFKKLKTYVKNPSSYVAPRFWYDDVISMKSVFLQDTLPLYVNNFMMIEDVGYHRYTNSMLNYFKTTINESMEDLLQGLGSMTEDVASLLDQGYGTSNTAIPTKMMSTIIKEMMKSYNDLYPGVFLSQVRDNIQAASRWYKKSTDGTLVDAVDSHISKIVLKDSWILSNVGSGVSPLLVNYNNELESALDKMLVSNQWSLSEPVLSTYGYENYSNEKTGKIIKKKYCSTNSNDIYTNYYFGTKVSDIVALDPKIVNGVLNTSGFDNPFSIYRGTFRNISGFDNEYVYESNKSRSSSGFVESLGSSYGIFDTQIEANRGYDLNAAPREADVYSGNKKPLYRQVTCTKWFKIFGWKIFCTRKGFEYVNTDKVESPEQFSLRNWGGASPLNLDTGLLAQEIPEYKLLSYNYKNAQMPIYDMGGATIVTGAKKDAYSVSSITSYPSLIKTQDRSGPLDYPYYVKLKGVSNSEVNYPESIWVPQSDGWRKFNGNKITFPYSDFLSQYEYTNNQGKSNNQIAKTITVGTESISWKSLSTLGGKCGSKFHEYFNYVYRLVSTIVKNVSPTSDQVNGTYESPFIGKGLFKRHYDFFRLELDNFTNEFSAVADGLTYVKKMQNIVNSTYATAQSFKNLSLTGSTVETLLSQLDLVMTGGQQIDFSGAFESLDDATLSFYALPNNEEAVAMIEYMSTYFDDMTEAELLDGKKTQFLQSWIDALLASGSSVKALARSLPTTYSTLSSAYSTLNTTNYGTGFLATKRAEINARQACGTYPSYIGQYASVCEQIDIKIALLNSYAANVASLATQEDEDDNGNKVTYKPFSDLTSSLSITNWFSNLDTLLSTLSGRVEHIKVMPAPLLVPGLNVTTKDRPIDSNRNVTFRGLAGDVVTFYYPNLYEVSVYDNIDGRLVLKTQKAIESAIKLYLINKAKEYNSLLTTQENKRVSYYSKHKSAFDFLSKVSQMATPNRGKTTLLDEKYFISLIQDRIPEIAEMLYYQSLPSYIRTAKSRVGDDMSQIRSSFDVNRKISYVMSGYLTKHDDLGPIVTPSYVTTGYEVAYINSDGNDYLPQTAVPDLISELQKKQFSYSSSTPSNSILQEESAYAKNISACKLGSDYTALLFDIKKGNSPWIDALKCWWKNIPTNTKFSISFSVGPSPKEFWNSLKTMYQDWKSSFKQLSQNTTPVFSGDLAEYWTNITQPVELVDTNTISKVDIVLSSTSSVMAGSQIPFTLLAKDKDGKIITSSVEDYYLEVGTGNGIIVDGINNSHTSIVFNEFDEAWIYQAPKVDKRTSVTLSLYKQDQLISSKQIWVDPAFLTVSSNGNKLYANNSTLRTLQYTIQSGGLLPTLRLQLLTPSGAPLDAAVSFSTKNGLVVPGQLSSDSFVGESSFLIQKGVLDVSLKSLFKAGDDILYVEIPGLDPIEIPLRILAGSPSKIDLSVDKNLLQVGQTLTGSLMVSDAWGNVVSGAKVDIGSLGSLGLSNKTVSVSSQGYSFSSKVLDPGGIGYVFANLVDVAQDEQYPAYQQITVQKPFLPEKDLNVMYLNLFGSDWGNQWAYGSEHKGYVSDLIDNSDKLLAVTTQLIDLNTLKKFTFVVGQNGQIHPFVDLDFSISFSGSNLQIDSDLASVSLVKTKHLTLDSLDQFSDFDQDNIEKPTLYVLQDSLDDTISISSNQLLSGADVLLDLDTGLFGSGISVSMEQDIYQGYNIWNLKSGSNILATLLLVLPSDTLLDSFDIHLSDVSQYATMETFADASTNGLKGVGIYTSDAIFQKEGYVSIEDSSDYKLGVGFTSDFKNITLFGDGQSVGESTVPYGSPFLVNYGDPLLKRISDNIELADIAQDTGIGHQVYSDPSKTIFKVISVDINNDAQKDLVIVFTDGTVKVLKNYGGTHPYRDIGELFRLVGGIQDIQLGDVDNNNYADLIVRTDQNQLRVYTNDRGVFDVDGKLVCLNTNTEQGKISSNPSDVSNTELFFEDMDQDGVLDIVSNDSIGDLKIFYGGISDDGVNYLSTLAYTCDANWYSRQKKSTLLVKRFGLSVDDSLYIQDHSLVHLKGWEISDDADTGIEDEDYGDAELPSDAPTWMASMGSNMSMSSLMSNMTSYFQEQAAVSLTTAFEESPIAEFTPSYESVADHDIVGYKKLLGLSGDKEIAIYKNYQDINGGILLSGDAVKITTTFLGLANGIKASYIDHLLGPWNVPLDKNDRITTWKIEEGTYAVDNVSWGYDDEEIQFVMDNIRLSKGDKLVVSYVVSYQGKPSVSVSIESIKHPKTSKSADQYPDILIKPDDSCKKYRWDFMNTSSNNHRNYDEIFDTSLQDAISSYLGSGSTEGNSLLNNAIPNFSNVSTGAGSESAQNGILDSVSSLLSSSLTEGWSLSSLFTPGSTNISLNMDAVDQALAPMMEKVDKAANALCQGFKLGKGGCQPPAPFNLIPFNQAFLAPGQYHLFGCTPKLPNPLAPVFAYLNKMLGGGMPVLFFPGTLITPLGPIPMIGSSFVPIVQKGVGDGFGMPGLPPLGGIYPSQVRFYIVPTLTLQMGLAICFGPYGVAARIPKLLRDLGGNCVVTAFPLYTNSCGSSSTTGDNASTEILEPWMTELASQGSCDNPPQLGSTRINYTSSIIKNTVSSPIYMSSRGESNASWTKAIPSGNLWSMATISFNDKPSKVSSTVVSSSPNSVGLSDFSFAGFKFTPGGSINLKVLGPNAKGIIKKFVQDWLSRQTKYIMNNLTKMTLSITLPNVTDLVKGFDTLQADTASDTAFIGSRNISNLTGINKIAGIASQQNYTAASDLVNNPFESLVNLFENVPLVRLQTKDIVVNVPMLTTENILKYSNYLKSWLNQQQKILKKCVEAVGEAINICGDINKSQATQALNDIPSIESLIRQAPLSSFLTQEKKEKAFVAITSYKKLLSDVINGTITKPNLNFAQDAVNSWKNTQGQLGLLAQKARILPALQLSINVLESKKTLNSSEQALLSRLKTNIQELNGCVAFSNNIDVFTNFYANSTSLVKNVQQNIQILEQYRKFPSQLSKWMGAANTYLSDITSFISNTVVVLMQWMNTNAKIYSKYVDALILIISSIKTWQILIDFSVNWNQKCGKCSRDSYGSYNCGLSFLLDKIKLPILPIPPFKIPNIYVDLSHIDLGMTIQLPKFRFVPMNIALPTIPNIPSPPSINISTSMDIDLNFTASLSKVLTIELPNIPILPTPPTLPELPSFIPKVDFALPTLPPAPKIPTLIPEISTTLDFASTLGRIFCITKGSVGLVGEKGVKAKVEQLTQRTWDVKSVDFFNKTVTWKKDPPLYGFDFKLDGYLQFKLDFDAFYGFLNQIVGDVNSFTTTAQSKIQKDLSKLSVDAQKKVTDFTNTNLKDIDFDFNLKTDVNINADILKSAYNETGVDYEIAAAKLKQDLAYFDSQVKDDPVIKQKIKTVRSVISDSFEITPTNKQILAVEKQVKSILSDKQQEIKTLASRIKKYDSFVAQVKTQDAVLVSNDSIDTLYSIPLFATSDENRKLLASQENPYKLSLDTNAGLVDRYLNTIKNSTAEDLGVTNDIYKKAESYLTTLSDKVDRVYDRLNLQPVAYDSCGVPTIVDTKQTGSPLLAANTTTTTTTTTAMSDDTAYDLSSYVSGIFVPKTTTTGTQMINVVKSDAYIEKIGDNYKVFAGDKTTDLNKDGLVDVLSWDTHTVYIKYSQQHAVPKKDLSKQSYDSTYYLYDGGSWYISSYNGLLETFYPDGDGYVSFGKVDIKLVKPYPEIKNFIVSGQEFDSVQFSWTSHSALGYYPDGYLVKLNQRIDTFADKDKNFNLGLSQDLLAKSYVLFLPKDTEYTDATIDFGEISYDAKGKSFSQEKLISQLLPGGQHSGALLTIKYYDPEDDSISSSLSEIPRHWQYAKVAALKNLGNQYEQKYVLGSVWSNQIVLGKQLLADTVGPSSSISLYRPTIKAVVSEGNDHKGYVGTNYTLQAYWQDNLSVSKMWISKNDTIIALKTGYQATGFIELSGLYFTGSNTLDLVFGAQDSQGNIQTDPVRLFIDIPELSVTDVSLTGNSGQIVAELSHDIDEGLVSFQRERNNRRQVITGTQSNILGGFPVKPLQTIVTGSTFSFSQNVGFYDTLNRQIGSLSPDGNMTILSQYADRYQIVLDITSTLPSLRVLDKKDSDTLFWVHLPPKKLVSMELGQRNSLYKSIPLKGSSFGAFNGGTCIQNSTQECIVYVSPLGEIYIPQQFVNSLKGSYFYNTTDKVVVYTLRDSLASDIDPYIVQFMLQVNIF